jgi:hypothetical protein
VAVGGAFFEADADAATFFAGALAGAAFLAGAAAFFAAVVLGAGADGEDFDADGFLTAPVADCAGDFSVVFALAGDVFFADVTGAGVAFFVGVSGFCAFAGASFSLWFLRPEKTFRAAAISPPRRDGRAASDLSFPTVATDTYFTSTGSRKTLVKCHKRHLKGPVDHYGTGQAGLTISGKVQWVGFVSARALLAVTVVR